MDFASLTARVRSVGHAGGDEKQWPADGVRLLRETGCLRAVVPHEFGGLGANPTSQLLGYEAVAAGNLSLALILTQHDAAVEVLVGGEAASVREEVLSACAGGDALLTVGISQLTTSRRNDGPAMRARPDRGDFILDGQMPWVTSARHADHVVTGAVLDDGRQLLACLPLDLPGLTVGEPADLLALQSSWTSEIDCAAVRVAHHTVLRGPMRDVLARRAPVKGLTVSSVGIGFARALLAEASSMADRVPGTAQLIEETIKPEYAGIRSRILAVADALGDPASEVPAVQIRAGVNDLVTRLAATMMTLAKGTGYLRSQPTQRLVREAAFFLVWSAPLPVQADTLRRIWRGTESATTLERGD